MGILSNEELKKLQKINIEMATYFVNFCNQHNLLCYLCGGGCIGTIRHHGMIPWDDDLDFFMPRDDYEKMCDLWAKENKNSRYVIEKADENHADGNLFVTIRDSQTTLVKPYQKDMKITHGVALDVIPIDGYPKGKMARKMQCFWALVYSIYCSQLIPVNHGGTAATVVKVALGIVPSKKLRYNIWKFAKKQMTKYPIKECEGITELCSGPGYMRNWYPREAFDEALVLPFEDRTMPIPKGYDEYLRIAFGDYMQLPPKEKQVGHHDALYMDLDTPYSETRQKYLNKEEK